MSDTLHIVERFTMEIEGPPPGRDAWFLDYVLRSPQQAGKHLNAGWQALHTARAFDPTLRSCREYFGGMGAQALMVQALWGMEDHRVLEYNQDAVDHLHRVLPSNVLPMQADSYDPKNTAAADLVLLDFGDLTVWKTREGEKHRELLDRVFLLEPKVVVITDIACRYLHLHKDRYETLLGPGTCGHYMPYLEALFERFRELYGYRLHRGFVDRWSTVATMVPEQWGEETLIETPDTPIGLQIF